MMSSLAYFGCHTDITIPYDELGSICAVDDDGDMIPVIEDGRFVLPGTEALNEAFRRICQVFRLLTLSVVDRTRRILVESTIRES